MFYDVGANVGTYTCFAVNRIDDGTVVMFEPHRMNVDRLWEKADLNDFDVDIRPVALSDETDTTDLAVSGAIDDAGV